MKYWQRSVLVCGIVGFSLTACGRSQLPLTTSPSQPSTPTAPISPTPVQAPPSSEIDEESQFFIKMEQVGYTLSAEEITENIRSLIHQEIAAWSPGRQKNIEKNINDKYQKNQGYFQPSLNSLDEFQELSLQLAALELESSQFYVNVRYGQQNNKLNLLKVNPKTQHVIYFNPSGLITSFTQNQGGLLKLGSALQIPAGLYLTSPEIAAARLRHLRQLRKRQFVPSPPLWRPLPRQISQ